MYNRAVRGPLINGDKSFHQISTDILAPTETKPGKWFCMDLSLLKTGA